MAVLVRKPAPGPDQPDLAALVEWRPGFRLFLVVAGLLAAAGIGGLVTQWQNGLGVTGMNTPTYWGIYIVNFVFLIGVSAGGILIASLAHAFGLHRFEPVGRVAELLAIMSLVLALLFITVDMGRPERIINMLLHGRLTSPLVWDFLVVMIYLGIALSLGFLATRIDLVRCAEALPGRRWLYRLMLLGRYDTSPVARTRDRHNLRVLAWIAIPGAVALHSVTAWILGLVKARVGWHNALLAPLFIVSAVISGMALVILVVTLIRRPLRLRIDDGLIQDMARLLSWGIPVLGYFLFAELLTAVYAGETHAVELFHSMVQGRFAWLFWFDLGGGLLIPWLLLIVPRLRSVATTGLAAALVVAGVLAERALIVLPSLAHPMLPVAAVPYTPTTVELVITVGIYALGALGIALLAKLFPLVPLHEEEAKGQAGDD